MNAIRAPKGVSMIPNTDIVIDKKWDGTIHVCYADFYHRIIPIPDEVIGGLIGNEIPVTVTTFTRKEEWFLIAGEGIKTFQSEMELNDFLKKAGFNGKIYTSDQIHKVIAT